VNEISKSSVVARWLVLAGAAILAAAFIYGGAEAMLRSPDLYNIMLKQFPAVVGLPCAALASLCLVMFLEHIAGPMEFEALGFRFKGSSGPVVLWVFCFLAIVVAIKVVWISA
jgi:hypothetical protein